MRRPMWLAAGVALGVGGTLWAEQRVRRGVRQAVDRFAPEQVVEGARDSARRVGDRVREAVATGREERARREAELWAELDGPVPQDRGGPGPGRRVATGAPARARGRPRPAGPTVRGPRRAPR